MRTQTFMAVKFAVSGLKIKRYAQHKRTLLKLLVDCRRSGPLHCVRVILSHTVDVGVNLVFRNKTFMQADKNKT